MQERSGKKDRQSKASETKGESLNLSSSFWVQNERRIVGWIIGAKPQGESKSSAVALLLCPEDEGVPDSLADRKICNHDSLACEWSYCGPVGHLNCHFISSLNRRIGISFSSSSAAAAQ